MQNPAKRFKSSTGGPGKKRQQQLSMDIVHVGKQGVLKTIPCLRKRVADVKDCIIGLQYVWEYRSPSKSVAPHYQCRLCKLQTLQDEMFLHVKGWKHTFKYLQQHHADKVKVTEEEANKDFENKNAIKELAKQVEKDEGRGKIREVLKEPNEVNTFQSMKSAKPKVLKPNPGQGMGFGLGMAPRAQPPSSQGRFGFSDFLASRPMPDFGSRDMVDMAELRGMCDSRDFRDMRDLRDLSMSSEGIDVGMRRYSDGGASMSGRMGADGFGMGGSPMGHGRPFVDDFRRGESIGLGDERSSSMMSRDMESNSIPATLLKYLDSFRIETESDAEIVLKVTQKLTDALMEYRLRAMSPGKSSQLSPMSMGYDRFSGGMGGHSGFYN